MKRKYILGIFVFATIFTTSAALAVNMPDGLIGEIVEEIHLWHFDAATIERGYTISSPDQVFNVGVLPGVLKGETDVTIKIFDHVNYNAREIYQVGPTGNKPSTETTKAAPPRLTVDWPAPEGKEIISPIYEFDIKGAAELYNPEVPLWLRVQNDHATTSDVGIYFWDKGKKSWIEIPAKSEIHDSSLRAAIHLTYAPIAVIAKKIPKVGEASWYAYQNCKCAASRDYPAGTLLEVSHEGTGNKVIVEVNDYGPEEWTGRIIDLDVVAFEELVPRGYGVTQVTVKPYILTEEEFNKTNQIIDDPLQRSK